MVETLRTLDLEIFTPYALNGPLFVKKRLGSFSRVLKGTARTQFEEAIGDYQNKVLKEYDNEATREISGLKQFFDFIKEDEVYEYG